MVGSARRFSQHIRAVVRGVCLGQSRRHALPGRIPFASRIVGLGLAVAAIVLPGAAVAHRGDGVFTLAEGRWLSGGWVPRDVAMLPDGSVVGVAASDAWRITPDGRRSSITGLGGTGVAATTDGGVLAIQGGVLEPFPGAFDDGSGPLAENRVLRWTPSVGVSVVAGTGEQGLGGDGGPATEALLNLAPRPVFALTPTGILSRPDGGFVFADTSNRRIRAVDPAGIIRTIAGGSKGTFHDPVGIAETPDGGFLVAEGYAGRVRRVSPDGAIEDVAYLMAQDVVVSVDGTAVIAAYDGQLWRLEPGSRLPRPYLRPKRATETFDFAARSTLGWTIGLDSQGGLLAMGNNVLSYVPAHATPWTLAALRSTRTSHGAVKAVIETTQPGTATVEIVQEDRTIARVTQPVAAGHSTLRAVGPIRTDWYDVRLRLDAATGATARDEVPIHGAPALTVQLARGLLGRYQGREADSETRYRLGRDCRQFGPRRVDCMIETNHECKVGIASLTLERTGVVLRRDYHGVGRERHHQCARPHFQGKPRFIPSHGVRRLSRQDKGRWASRDN
jgi:hypothetical protein